jgi:hypothetical protein
MSIKEPYKILVAKKRGWGQWRLPGKHRLRRKITLKFSLTKHGKNVN